MPNTNVVKVGPNTCKPFILQVFVASAEAGYKFELVVEKMCSSANEALWKLVFDLYKKDASGTFQQIVHVSFTPVDPDEKSGVQALATEPISVDTARILRNSVHPAAKDFAQTATPTAAQKKKLHDAMSKAAKSAKAADV